MRFKLRNEVGLHCRFCGGKKSVSIPLYETFPVKGIVCAFCKKHLGAYKGCDEFCGHQRPQRDVLCQREANHKGRHRAVIFWEDEQ